MQRQRHTVIFVPHAHAARARLRKWQVSNLQILFAGASLLLLSLVASWLAWSHFNSSVSPAEMTRLRHENARLRQVNQTFETSIQSLQTKLTSSEDRTRQLAIMAGLESLGAGADVGIGGGAPLDGAAPEDLAALQSRAGQMQGALDAIEVKLGERVRWMSSTPTIAPVRGILTSGFGTRSDPMTHGPGLHQGIDIAAAAGQPVFAAADGLVVLAASTSGYGEAVYLAHGFGGTTPSPRSPSAPASASTAATRSAASAAPAVPPARTSTTKCASTAPPSTPSPTSSTTPAARPDRRPLARPRSRLSSPGPPESFC